MRVLIVGPGPLGIGLAAELDRRGAELAVLGRGGPRDLSVRYSDERGETSLRLPGATPTFVASADLAFVAVKAFDLEQALVVTQQLRQGAVVVPLANGAVWDLVRVAANRADHCRFRLGFSTVAVSAVEPGRYALRSRGGEVSFGPLTPGDTPTPDEKTLVEPHGFFGWHANIEVLARRKWLYNTVINSLTAARRLARNEDLLGDLPTLAAVFNEALALATELWGPLPMESRALYEGMIQLIERTADNENSMARDRRLGRQTESDFLAGLAKDVHRYPLLTELQKLL